MLKPDAAILGKGKDAEQLTPGLHSAISAPKTTRYVAICVCAEEFFFNPCPRANLWIQQWNGQILTPRLHGEKSPLQSLGQDPVGNDPEKGIFPRCPWLTIRGVPRGDTQISAARPHCGLAPLDSLGNYLVTISAQELVFFNSPKAKSGIDVPTGTRHTLAH
jgi:hypothetical protein